MDTSTEPAQIVHGDLIQFGDPPSGFWYRAVPYDEVTEWVFAGISIPDINVMLVPFHDKKCTRPVTIKDFGR